MFTKLVLPFLALAVEVLLEMHRIKGRAAAAGHLLMELLM
jgi:hypothetical protein